MLGPMDRVRYLGWFTAMSNEVDESFKQMKEECDDRLGKMASKRCTGGEFMQFVKIAEVPRILHRMRHSDTGKESIDKIQTMYNKTYRLKGRIVRSMPNEVMWSSKERCGMDWVNFWDEISIDRIVAWMKHANSGGVVGEIAAAAIKRSEEIAPSTTATLEQEEWTTWDGTMMGRIVEWMTGDIGRGFSITGGKVNRGKRENDVAISEINNDRRWASMIAAGCRITGIHWISETLTDDDNTWVSELQNNGKFNNNGYFKWKHYTHDAKTAERKTLKKRTKWSEWTKHVKRITKQAIEEKEEENEQMEMAKSSDDSESAEEGEDEEGELMVTKLEMGRLGMTMTQARGETNILVTNVENGGAAERGGIKFGMILVKVGTATVWGWEKAYEMLSNRSDTTTVTFRQCTEKSKKEAESARKVAQSERQDGCDGHLMRNKGNEQSETTKEEDGGDGSCSATLGRYWKDSYPELKPMDMVRAHGARGGVKMVISQKQEQVEVVTMVDCTDMNDGADHGDPTSGYIMKFDNPEWDNEDGENMGIHNTVKTNGIVYTVTDKKIETWGRNDLTKTAGELMKVTRLGSTEARKLGRRRAVEACEIHEKGHGNQGSAFGRIWETKKKSEVTMREEKSVVAGGEKEENITQHLSICGEGNDVPVTNETRTRIETVKQKKERMEKRNKQWKEQAEEIGQNASILAGGDGSRKERNGETIAAYGWGVYGIGEHSVEYWKKISNIQMFESWLPEGTWIGPRNMLGQTPEQNRHTFWRQ